MPRNVKGGKRTPDSPAPVSGPGALSARTDGGPAKAAQPIREIPGGEFGSRQESADLQRSAPLPATNPTPAPAEGALPPPPVVERRIDPFGPTARPDEPITTGADPGLALQGHPPDPDLAIMAKDLPLLEAWASRPNASVALKVLVRRIRGSMPVDATSILLGPE